MSTGFPSVPTWRRRRASPASWWRPTCSRQAHSVCQQKRTDNPLPRIPGSLPQEGPHWRSQHPEDVSLVTISAQVRGADLERAGSQLLVLFLLISQLICHRSLAATHQQTATDFHRQISHCPRRPSELHTQAPVLLKPSPRLLGDADVAVSGGHQEATLRAPCHPCLRKLNEVSCSSHALGMGFLLACPGTSWDIQGKPLAALPANRFQLCDCWFRMRGRRVPWAGFLTFLRYSDPASASPCAARVYRG